MPFLARENVGGIVGEPKFDRPRRRKRPGDRGYVPPPVGGVRKNHPAAPAGQVRTAPDPNTRPTVFQGMSIDRRDARRKLPRPVKRRAPVLPLQIPPTRIAEDYCKLATKLVGRMRAAYAPVIRMIPTILEQAATARGDTRLDVDETKKLRELLTAAVENARRAISQPEIEGLARKIAARTGDYHKSQLGRQIKAALGVDPIFKDKGLAARTDQFTHENVALIRRLPETTHSEIERMVTRAVAGGKRAEGRAGSLQEDIESRFDVAESHARVIARDQTLKFYAGVNKARQQEMGITRYVWRTVGDERVRGDPAGKYPNANPSHWALDDKTFSYDDPPEAGPDGEPCNPGEAVQCRCWAEPVFDDLLGDDDEDDAGEGADNSEDDE